MAYLKTYEKCPNCGEANGGAQYCRRCGALIVKERSGFITQTPQEMANAQADAGYRKIYGQSAAPGLFLRLACPIAGGILLANAFLFLTVYIVSVIGLRSGAFFPPAIIGGVLLLMGIGVFIPLIVGKANYKKCRENGREFTGIVRGYDATSVMVNHKRVLNVRLLIWQAPQPYILVLSADKTQRPYPLGATLLLKEYKGRYLIMGQVG